MRTTALRPFNYPYTEDHGKFLASALNELKKRAPGPYAGVAQIMEEFDSIANSKPIPYIPVSDQSSCGVFNGEEIRAKDPRDVPEMAAARLSGRLEEYLCFPSVDRPTQGRWKGRWRVVWQSHSFLGTVVHHIVSLAERDLLRRVRECKQCKDWFYANRINKVFCTPACSKLKWQGSPEGRESRKVYMREYMSKRRK